MNKPMETYRSGAQTPFNDAAGIVIRVHDYIKDEDGNRYNVNTYLQAVPEGEAPAVELKELMKTKKVYVMDAKEVLQVKKPAETNLRGGRRHRKAKSMMRRSSPLLRIWHLCAKARMLLSLWKLTVCMLILRV